MGIILVSSQAKKMFHQSFPIFGVLKLKHLTFHSFMLDIWYLLYITYGQCRCNVTECYSRVRKIIVYLNKNTVSKHFCELQSYPNI